MPGEDAARETPQARARGRVCRGGFGLVRREGRAGPADLRFEPKTCIAQLEKPPFLVLRICALLLNHAVAVEGMDNSCLCRGRRKRAKEFTSCLLCGDIFCDVECLNAFHTQASSRTALGTTSWRAWEGSEGGAASAAADSATSSSQNSLAAASAAAGSAAAFAPLSLNLETPEPKVRERRGSSGGAPGAK